MQVTHAAVPLPVGSRSSAAGPARAPERPLRVLVAEDDDAAREALVKAVRMLGHDCRGARDGLEAWEVQQRDHVDVILSDWQMPRMDGLELCRRMRSADDDGRYTYFILMTSFADKDHFLRGMDAGADDYHAKPVDIDELRARLVSAGRVVTLYRRLAEKNAVLRNDSQRSFHVARVDSLTAVANRLAMDEELKALWSRVVRYGHRYSMAIGDVDRFKAYNDHFGHLAGDEVLRRVTQTIRAELREGDSVYRYGGDEFVVLLPEQSLAEAARAMDRVRVAVERIAIPAPGNGLAVVTISCGVTELDLSTDRAPEDSLRRADGALYHAKAAGRNLVETDPAS